MSVQRKIGLIVVYIVIAKGHPALIAAEIQIRFSDFPVKRIELRRSATPQIASEMIEAKGYRAVEADAHKSSNFAGHYRISTDTCGTWMIVIMVADSNTGEVYMEGCVSWPYKGVHPSVPIGLSYRLDSRLLIARGCRVSQEPCGTFFYEFENGRLILRGFVPFKDGYRDTGVIPEARERH